MGSETPFASNESLVGEGSLVHVGLYEELAPNLKKARHLRNELLSYQEALLMTLFPPRVRKVNEDALDRAVGLEPPQREGGVLGEDSGARA